MNNENRTFHTCPSCGSVKIVFERVDAHKASEHAFGGVAPYAYLGDGLREHCLTCSFVANYVQFSCGHCNPDIFAVCPRHGCGRGRPLGQLCMPEV